MLQNQQESQQESLLNITALTTQLKNLNSATASVNADVNESDLSPSTNPKPTLIKVNKKEATMENKPQSFRNTQSRFMNNTNTPSNNSSSNLNTNSNTNFTNPNTMSNLTRSIEIVASTFARAEDIYLRVQRDFVYKPNIGLVINAMVETGRFDAKRVADNICIVFAEKEGRDNRRSAVNLSYENLQKCRQVQQQVREILDMDIDIHPVLNSMIYTGGFTPIEVSKAVRKIFLQKRQAVIQKSKTIN